MMRRLAMLLCDLAGHLLPPVRREWGTAMAAELAAVEDDLAALSFASGCLLAAAKERAHDFDSRFAAALWSIGLITMVLAAERVACAAHGVEVLLGANDGMLTALQHGGSSPTLIAAYERARPIVIACFFTLGLAQFATAWLVIRGDLRCFWLAWGLTLLVATTAVAIQLSVIWTPGELPSEFFPSILQVVALPALLSWSNGRYRQGKCEL